MTQGQALLRAVATGITTALEAIMNELEEGRLAQARVAALEAEKAAREAAELPENTEHPAPAGTE